jgi:hypothetical protein
MDHQLMLKAMSFIQTHEPVAIIAENKATGKLVAKFTRKIDAAQARLLMQAITEEVENQ